MAREQKVKIKFEADTRQAQRELGRIRGAFSSFGNFLSTRFVFTFTEVFRVASQALDAFKEAAQLDAQERALRNSLTNIGQDFDGFIAKLQQVSDSTVSTADLIRSSSTALLLGIPAEEIAALLEVARAAAVATGQETAQAFDDIARGIGRTSPLILDNLGIVVDLNRAYQDYAATVGKTVKELDEIEKKQALTNQVLEAGQKIIENVGDTADTAATNLAQLTVQLEDFKTEAIDTVVETGVLTVAIEALRSTFVGFTSIITALRAPFEAGRALFDFVAEAIKNLGNITGDTSEATEGLGEAFEETADKVDIYTKALERAARIQEEENELLKESEQIAKDLGFTLETDLIAAQTKREEQLERILQLQRRGLASDRDVLEAEKAVAAGARDLTEALGEEGDAFDQVSDTIRTNVVELDRFAGATRRAQNEIERLKRQVVSLRNTTSAVGSSVGGGFDTPLTRSTISGGTFTRIIPSHIDEQGRRVPGRG